MNKKGTAPVAASAQENKADTGIVALNRASLMKKYGLNLHKTDFADCVMAPRRYARRGLLKAGYTPEEADAMLYRMGYRKGGEV
jgi:hypothetical protein